MQLSTSSYYDYLKRLGYMGLEDDIERQVISAFWRHKRRYGTRRIVSELSDEGYLVGRQRVRSILEDHGLREIQPKAFVPRTTQTHPHLRRSPNLLLDRDNVVGCNQVGVNTQVRSFVDVYSIMVIYKV